MRFAYLSGIFSSFHFVAKQEKSTQNHRKLIYRTHLMQISIEQIKTASYRLMIFSSNTLPFSSESFRMYIPGAKPLMSMVPKSLCCVFTRRPEMSYRLMLSIFAPEGFSMFMILEAGLGLQKDVTVSTADSSTEVKSSTNSTIMFIAEPNWPLTRKAVTPLSNVSTP